MLLTREIENIEILEHVMDLPANNLAKLGQICYAGKSKTAHMILIFSISLG